VDTPTPPAPTPTPTPAPEYLAIRNTGGDNVALPAEPRADANRLVRLRPGTLLLVVGPDTTTDGKPWRNVRTISGDPATGWVMAQYLLPAAAP
jgi:hypothetical protein